MPSAVLSSGAARRRMMLSVAPLAFWSWVIACEIIATGMITWKI
jgi:hypothetical protein